MAVDLPIRRWLNVILPIGAIGLLIVLILPAIQQSREAARRSIARNNYKQLGLAIQNYSDVYKVLPLGANVDTDGVGYHGWVTRLVPFLSATPLYNQLDQNQPWDSPRNEPLMRIQEWGGALSPFVTRRTASPEGYALVHHAGNPNVLHRNHCITFADMTAGTTETWMLGEAGGDFLPWGYPFNWRPLENALNHSPPGYGLPGRPMTYFLMADGSVRALSSDADPQVLRALQTSPPIATAEQSKLPPRPEKFRTSGARREYVPLAGDYRASVCIYPQTQEIEIDVHQPGKTDDPNAPPPTPDVIRSVIVGRYPECTSLSVPLVLNRELASMLSRLPKLSHLEVKSLENGVDGIKFVESLNGLRSICILFLPEAVELELHERLPHLRTSYLLR